MKCYYIQIFFGGVQCSISAVKHERIFYQTISKLLHDKLAGAMFTLRVYDGGIIVESGNISDAFLGTTIPFIYQNRRLELRVYPEAIVV
jgi:hypothetical protein